MINYLIYKNQLNNLIKQYDFLKYFSIGKSVLNNEIYCVKFGNGNKQIMYSAGIHANEYITSILLIKFIEDLSIAYKNNSKIYDYSIQDLYNTSSIYIIPMLNPDGINLVNNFYDSNSKIYNKCLYISNKYPNLRFPLDWKANINGVDFSNFQHTLLINRLDWRLLCLFILFSKFLHILFFHYLLIYYHLLYLND